MVIHRTNWMSCIMKHFYCLFSNRSKNKKREQRDDDKNGIRAQKIQWICHILLPMHCSRGRRGEKNGDDDDAQENTQYAPFGACRHSPWPLCTILFILISLSACTYFFCLHSHFLLFHLLHLAQSSNAQMRNVVRMIRLSILIFAFAFLVHAHLHLSNNTTCRNAGWKWTLSKWLRICLCRPIRAAHIHRPSCSSFNASLTRTHTPSFDRTVMKRTGSIGCVPLLFIRD